MNCPIKLKNTSTRVPWWNTELSKLTAETRKVFNRAREASTSGDWAQFRESQRAYKRATAVAKRYSWKKICDSTETAPEASSLHRILSEVTNTRLDCLQLPTGEHKGSMEGFLNHLIEIHLPDFRKVSPGIRPAAEAKRRL